MTFFSSALDIPLSFKACPSSALGEEDDLTILAFELTLAGLRSQNPAGESSKAAFFAATSDARDS